MRRLRSSSIKSRGAAFLALLVCLFSVSAAAQPWDGNGVEGDPYLIYDACDMQAIGADANFWDAHFKLMTDIDLCTYTGTSFNIIGTFVNPFIGTFDGNGHTISNFTYNSTGTSRIGIFGYVDDPNAEIKDLGLIDPNVEVIGGSGNVGSLVGRLVTGTVSRCYVEAGTVSADPDYDIGGLVGNSEEGLIRESYSTASVFGGIAAGGLVGYNEGAISDCHSSGDVTTSNFVGGLVGYNRSTILNCYSTSNVAQGSFIGGLVGYDNLGLYTKCFWDSDVNPDVNGIGNTTDPNVIGETTANMQTESTFTDAGWDFVGEVINGPNDVWTICEGEDYPRLAWEKYGGGNGAEANPYLIRTSCQMNAIGTDSNDWDKHFKLMADIDLGSYTGTQFNIIGNNTTPFTGVFDGNNHRIFNLTYNTSTLGQTVALFAYADTNCVIKDLTFYEPNIMGEDNVGVLVGRLYNGVISNCHVVSGSISGNNLVAGLISVFDTGIITSCSSGADVNGNNGDFTGGLVAISDGAISNSFATGDVHGFVCVGGLIGSSYSGTVSDCYAKGSVTGYLYMGGLVGSSDGMISNCYSTGNVSGEERVGGLVGQQAMGSISSSYSTGVVSGDRWVGGLVGMFRSGATLSNCYSTASVCGESEVGGLIGRDSGWLISNCYSAGCVDGNSLIGGLIGLGGGGVTKCFWDSNVNPDVNGIGNGSDPNVIGETTTNMQTESTFTDAGWDFVGEVINGPNDIWDICEGTNYPKFVWQIPAADFVCPDGVTLVDFSVLGLAWYSDPNQPNWNLICDISEPNDNFIDELDLKVFTDNWLAGL